MNKLTYVASKALNRAEVKNLEALGFVVTFLALVVSNGSYVDKYNVFVRG